MQQVMNAYLAIFIEYDDRRDGFCSAMYMLSYRHIQ